MPRGGDLKVIDYSPRYIELLDFLTQFWEVDRYHQKCKLLTVFLGNHKICTVRESARYALSFLNSILKIELNLSELLRNIFVKDFDSFVDRTTTEVSKLTDSLTDQVKCWNSENFLSKNHYIFLTFRCIWELNTHII